MKQSIFTVETNEPIARGVFKMTLSGDTSAVTAPGQFVNVKLPGRYLRRPISVCDLEDGLLTLVYKIVGEGTADLSRMGAGTELDLLTGLGNGFDVSRPAEKAALVGGGVGVPPLLLLAKRLLARGVRPEAFLGFASKEDAILIGELSALGVNVRVATVDGSLGTRGFVTDLLPADCGYYYACGPVPMLRALLRTAPADGQLSFEERMGCGFGACMGCTMQTKSGPKRVCRDGPVFEKSEVIPNA